MDAGEVVRALAAALDRDDFARVAPLLAADCAYDTGREILRGPAAIVASYRAATEWAHAHLDSIQYESAVEPAVGDDVGVIFTDRVEHQGRPHVHQCRQVFTVGRDGRVTHIVHHDLPGESAAMKAFFDACGLER